MRTTEPPDVASYSYAGAGYANPHAVTQIGNGNATTTYEYDNNGNLTSAGNGTATTSYSYDYANRLIAILYNNATTSSYGYDAFGARVYQISASTSAATTTYPFKFYSVASTTKSSTNYATSTEYVFNGDTLLATVDQAFKNGSATGTSITSYIHPDHLGSTNVITNASGTVVQTLDYYPYGGTRISTNVGGANSARKFIGQFSDQSNLDYLQARYYDPGRGQFLSEDPVFWEIGLTTDGMKALANPQYVNAYAYSSDNPITGKDPSGRQGYDAFIDAGSDIAGSAPYWGQSISSALSWAGSVASGIGAAILYNSSDISLRISNGIKYGGETDPRRIVRLSSNLPDPTGNPWPDWKPGDPKDWKTWLQAAPSAITVGGVVSGIAWTTKQVLGNYYNVSPNQGGYNSQVYTQSVSYSQATGKPSNAASSGSSGGGNSNYASQTYVLPNGKITDWFGNIIPALPLKKN